ncbi:hypothetical protein BHE74_00047209 [Ensete ventricosum]|nr:hypothetical protein BHE74_00047209 [Ensete ventricosum]
MTLLVITSWIGIVEGGRRWIGIEKGCGRQVRAEVRRAQVHRDVSDGASVTPQSSFSMLPLFLDASPSSLMLLSLLRMPSSFSPRLITARLIPPGCGRYQIPWFSGFGNHSIWDPSILLIVIQEPSILFYCDLGSVISIIILMHTVIHDALHTRSLDNSGMHDSLIQLVTITYFSPFTNSVISSI